MMDGPERYRRARHSFEEALHHLIGMLDPEIAESAVGRTAIVSVLISKAVELMSESLEPSDAKALLIDLIEEAMNRHR